MRHTIKTSFGTLSLRDRDILAGLATLDEAAELRVTFSGDSAALVYRQTLIRTGRANIAFFIAKRQDIQAARTGGAADTAERT